MANPRDRIIGLFDEAMEQAERIKGPLETFREALRDVQRDIEDRLSGLQEEINEGRR